MKKKLHSECLFLCVFLSITKEKREEYRRQILVGFYPILGFLGYILCSFVCGWCIMFFISFIFLN
jgi:hypothetical protein